MGHLWLIGMMGAGKTEAGRRAADALGVPFVDTDRDVEERAGMPVARYWDEHGEDEFRRLEAEAVAAAAAGPRSVVAAGGGAVLRRENVAVMQESGTVVWLEAPPDMLTARLDTGAGRPLLGTGDDFERLVSLLAEREATYGAAAEVVLDTSDLALEDVAAKLAEMWTAS